METTLDYIDEPRGKIFAEFTRPRNIIDPVIVSRYLPDSTLERIGSIYSGFNENDEIVFTCVDRNGKMLFPATTEYCTAEEKFETYAKKLTIKAIEKQRAGKSQEFADRVNELKKLRDKNKEERDQQINR